MADNIKIDELSEVTTYSNEDYLVLDNGQTTNKIQASRIGGGLDETDIVEIVYPVGSIYMSVNNVNPNELFIGTTWTRLQDRFLLGAGSTYSAGVTGGSSTVTLSTNEMPSHNHTTYFRKSGGAGNGSWDYLDPGSNYGAASSNTGGGLAHDNMPPYLVVYMWKRTA